MRWKMGSILLLALCMLASMLHTINCAEGEHHHVCDDGEHGIGVLFMHTQDKLDYKGAEKFCSDRGAVIPHKNVEGSCMNTLSTQLQGIYGRLFFWTTAPGLNGPDHFGADTFGYNGEWKQIGNNFNVACFDNRICLRPTDPGTRGSYGNGVFSQQEGLNTLTLTCNQGYEVVGNPKVTCLKAPRSITSLAGCTKICTKPTVPNGTFRKGSFNGVNNTLPGTCDNGYTAVQQLKATCDFFGRVTVVGKCVKD
ncbi:uncharacterized protein LOC135829764 [Sycon ciliatum]|uniref:uncharacterized protein LOC135829764 n=1 Tax=Sycon ciliatum TaxID=27933 RepID=UPI0031F5F459